MGKTTTSPPNSSFADKLHAGIDAGSAALEAAKDAYSMQHRLVGNNV